MARTRMLEIIKALLEIFFLGFEAAPGMLYRDIHLQHEQHQQEDPHAPGPHHHAVHHHANGHIILIIFVLFNNFITSLRYL